MGAPRERCARGATGGQAAADDDPPPRRGGPARRTVAFTADHGARITSWSPAAAALFDRPAERALGQPCHSLFPASAHSALAEAHRAAARGLEHRAEVELTAGGLTRRLALDCSPLIDAAGESGMLCQVGDVEELRRTESQTAFVDALMQTSPFGLALIDSDLRYVLVNDALAEFNGLSAAAHTGRRVSEVVRVEDGGAFEKALREVVESGRPVRNVAVGGQGMGRPDRDGVWSVSLFRLANGDGRVLGVGGMVVDVTEKETALLEASAVRRRLALVNQASARIGTTLDLAQTARELTEVAVPAFADVASVEIRKSLFDDGDFPPADRPVATVRLASRNTLPSQAAVRLFSDRGEVVHPVGSSSHECMCTGRTWYNEVLDEARIAAWAFNEEAARLMSDSGVRSLVMVPLVARGRLIGMAKFGRSARREPISHEDMKIAEELAARAAVCLDNAQLYSNERNIAVALQRSMLPGDADIPDRPGLEIARHYRPSRHAARVGGDWFDVIALSGHRIALVVGDIMGHDIRAAASMGQLRSAMRALARLDLEPVELLTRLDDVVQHDATTEYATCVYAVYDTVTRRCSIANAGHPAPVLRRPDGATEVVPVSPGVPLGVGVGDPGFAVTDLVLPEDSTLVLYTDGLIERRGEDIDAGLEALRQALAGSAAGVEELCERVVEELHGSGEDDDLAVLMARAPAVPGHRSAGWRLPSDPRSASRARSLVRSALTSWGLLPLVPDVELMVSELVTNAVRHARGRIELRLAKGATLVCEVADGDERMPRHREAEADDERGRGLTLVSEFAREWGTRPTAAGKVVWFEAALPPAHPEPAERTR